MRLQVLFLLIGGAAVAAPARAAIAADTLGLRACAAPMLICPLPAAPDLASLDEPYRLPPAPAPRTSALAPAIRVPGAMELTLGALASLGVVRGLRTLKKAPLVGVLPDWYHDAAPLQLGHATPLDVSAFHVLLACPLAAPAAPAAPLPQLSCVTRPLGSAASPSLLQEAPRGPPPSTRT